MTLKESDCTVAYLGMDWTNWNRRHRLSDRCGERPSPAVVVIGGFFSSPLVGHCTFAVRIQPTHILLYGCMWTSNSLTHSQKRSLPVRVLYRTTTRFADLSRCVEVGRVRLRCVCSVTASLLNDSLFTQGATVTYCTARPCLPLWPNCWPNPKLPPRVNNTEYLYCTAL